MNTGLQPCALWGCQPDCNSGANVMVRQCDTQPVQHDDDEGKQLHCKTKHEWHNEL
jgi:hypothetical protein